MEAVVAYFILSVVVFVIGVGFYGVMGGFDDPFEPMSYEEEIDWLVNEQGLSEEEAKKIAELPWRG